MRAISNNYNRPILQINKRESRLDKIIDLIDGLKNNGYDGTILSSKPLDYTERDRYDKLYSQLQKYYNGTGINISLNEYKPKYKDDKISFELNVRFNKKKNVCLGLLEGR
jgi:hypothetical protein